MDNAIQAINLFDNHTLGYAIIFQDYETVEEICLFELAVMHLSVHKNESKQSFTTDRFLYKETGYYIFRFFITENESDTKRTVASLYDKLMEYPAEVATVNQFQHDTIINYVKSVEAAVYKIDHTLDCNWEELKTACGVVH